jgi:hypothetical protein
MPQSSQNGESEQTPKKRTRWFFFVQTPEDETPKMPTPPEAAVSTEQNVDAVDSRAAFVAEESTPTPQQPGQSEAIIQPEPDDTPSPVAAKPKGKRKKKANIPDTSPAANDRPSQAVRIRTRRQLEWPDGNASDARQDE